MVVVDKGSKVVLVHDGWREEPDGDAHVLVARHGGVEVEVLDVDGHELGVGSGEDAVEEGLDGG